MKIVQWEEHIINFENVCFVGKSEPGFTSPFFEVWITFLNSGLVLQKHYETKKLMEESYDKISTQLQLN